MWNLYFSTTFYILYSLCHRKTLFVRQTIIQMSSQSSSKQSATAALSPVMDTLSLSAIALCGKRPLRQASFSVFSSLFPLLRSSCPIYKEDKAPPTGTFTKDGEQSRLINFAWLSISVFQGKYPCGSPQNVSLSSWKVLLFTHKSEISLICSHYLTTTSKDKRSASIYRILITLYQNHTLAVL